MCLVSFACSTRPTGPFRLAPIAGLSTVFEPIGRPPREQIQALAEVECPLPSDLAFTLVAALRQHGHFGNVLTHISGTNWTKVEQSLRSISDPDVGSQALSPLAQNIVELICGDRGVTGRIMKSYFRTVLGKVLGIDGATRLIQRINGLFVELKCARQQPSNTGRIANQCPAAREAA